MSIQTTEIAVIGPHDPVDPGAPSQEMIDGIGHQVIPSGHIHVTPGETPSIMKRVREIGHNLLVRTGLVRSNSPEWISSLPEGTIASHNPAQLKQMVQDILDESGVRLISAAQEGEVQVDAAQEGEVQVDAAQEGEVQVDAAQEGEASTPAWFEAVGNALMLLRLHVREIQATNNARRQAYLDAYQVITDTNPTDKGKVVETFYDPVAEECVRALTFLADAEKGVGGCQAQYKLTTDVIRGERGHLRRIQDDNNARKELLRPLLDLEANANRLKASINQNDKVRTDGLFQDSSGLPAYTMSFAEAKISLQRTSAIVASKQEEVNKLVADQAKNLEVGRIESIKTIRELLAELKLLYNSAALAYDESTPGLQQALARQARLRQVQMAVTVANVSAGAARIAAQEAGK